MTADEAFTLYYDTYQKLVVHDGNPGALNQKHIQLASFQAVIDAVRKEAETEMIKRTLLPVIESDANVPRLGELNLSQ